MIPEEPKYTKEEVEDVFIERNILSKLYKDFAAGTSLTHGIILFFGVMGLHGHYAYGPNYDGMLISMHLMTSVSLLWIIISLRQERKRDKEIEDEFFQRKKWREIMAKKEKQVSDNQEPEEYFP